MSLGGLAQINLETTAKCDKSCPWCGHQNPKVNPEIIHAGHMDLNLLREIVRQVPRGVVLQLHRDGEPLVYPYLGAALDLMKGHIVSMVTNAKKLGQRAGEIVGNCTSVTVSVFEGDPDGPQQRESVGRFLEVRGACRGPELIVKFVGEVSEATRETWAGIGTHITRSLHHPAGSRLYRNATPLRPEHGICLDLLHKPAVDWKGRMYLCVRLDPKGVRFIGDLCDQTLEEVWNSGLRRRALAEHVAGRRASFEPCAGCEFWGLPVA